jgi:tripartite-type tricarboxylate transporter receptor subunit TctC
MGSKFRWLIAAIVSGGCLTAISMETLAQAYPTRPVRLVIGWTPGGPTDLLGRIVAQKLGDILGEQIVVENRPGAAGAIGAASVTKAPADGYTLLLESIAAFAVNPNFYKLLPYDSRKDFTPIGPVASGAIFLYVNASLPARNLQELIALAKSKPGALSFGSAGTGHYATHIAPELLKMKNGLDMLHVPYKGSGPAMIDVVAGRTSFMMSSGVAVAKPFLDSGKVRALAITGEKRSAVLPDVPTFAEAGSPLPEMNAGAWFGLLGPPGLPRNIVVKLNESLAQTLAAPDLLAKFAALNLDPMTSTPEAFANFINAAVETWAQILKRANITPE